jgi:hypothetical protein
MLSDRTGVVDRALLISRQIISRLAIVSGEIS